MQLENNIKVISKAKNQDTASQCDAPTAMSEGRNNRFNQTLKTTQNQCVASISSQIVNPIMWAAQLERENSGFSV
ncbi:MAG: hypothetical protein HOC18_10755 [Candidatus Marinimicrobia bacterium]|jgi:hypothetical protein|nr:hypothetical protein [Candidatus Neomarinimicrobiota bacterium]